MIITMIKFLTGFIILLICYNIHLTTQLTTLSSSLILKIEELDTSSYLEKEFKKTRVKLFQINSRINDLVFEVERKKLKCPKLPEPSNLVSNPLIELNYDRLALELFYRIEDQWDLREKEYYYSYTPIDSTCSEDDDGDYTYLDDD